MKSRVSSFPVLSGIWNHSLNHKIPANVPQPVIDQWTNKFFFRLHPELIGRKISIDEVNYINEWQAIEKVVRHSLVYQKYAGHNFGSDWYLLNYDTQVKNGVKLVSCVLDNVADAIFYQRHPELQNRRIRPGETALAYEWVKIREIVSELPPRN